MRFISTFLRTPPLSPLFRHRLSPSHSSLRACHTVSQNTWSSLSSTPTVRAAIHRATHLFTLSQTPEPAASAYHLALAAFSPPFQSVNINHHHDPVLRIRPDFEARPSSAQLSKYVHLCQLRADHRVPVQYLVGEWDFHHITLRVKSPVLIPRPETEELVQLVLEDERIGNHLNAKVLDVGFGSGCIMLALLAARPHWRAWGVDPAQEAYDLCMDNIKLLRLEDRAIITRAKICELQLPCKVDVLVSNPPYIPRSEMESLAREVREHEDQGALCGGEDGMDVIDEVLRNAPRLVRKSGSIWLEVDTTQPDKLSGMMFEAVEFVKKIDDLYGRPRFVHFRVL